MQTVYQTEMTPGLINDLTHDFPEVFGSGGLYVLEVWDWDAALTLSGTVEVHDNEDGIYLTVDGWDFPLTEA